MSNKKALVTGASSGLGASIATHLNAAGFDVVQYDIQHGLDVRKPPSSAAVTEQFPTGLDVLVNCAGVNLINWADEVMDWDWDNVMDVNAKALFFMTQAFLLPLRQRRGTVLNVVSNAATMPMRCSAAYNASKGAALILTKQLARELSPEVTVFSVSPNKLSGTGMSESIDRQVVRTRGWTEEQAREYQLAGLLTGKETPPDVVGEFVGFLLSKKERHEYLAGCDLPYGA